MSTPTSHRRSTPKHRLLSVAFAVPALIALVAAMLTLTTTGAISAPGDQGLVSIYPSSTVPDNPAEEDNNSVELGVRFSVDVPGVVVGLKFYKSAANTGPHVGSLWTSGGRRLASADFTAESTTGWQTVRFDSPVALDADQTYVASYYTPSGYYAQQEWAFSDGATLGNRVIQATSGVYAYGGSAFPTSTWHSAAYYVDVLFDPTDTTVSSSTTSKPTTTEPTTTEPTTTEPTTTEPTTASEPPTSTNRPTSTASSTSAAPTTSRSKPPTSTEPTTTEPTTTEPTVPPTSTSPPAATGFPTSADTGVPAGTALTTYTGSCNLAAGTVIDAKILNCPVEIMGAGVKITRSQINGIVQSDHSDSGRGSASVTISDSNIDGGQQETFPAVSYDSVTLLRDEVVGGEHSVQCNSNCTVTDSYLHGQYLPSSSAGHVNAFISNGGSGFTLRHNTLWCSVAQTASDGGCSGDASLFGDFGPINDVVLDDNLFHNTGGSFCLFGGITAGKPFQASNVTVTNNVFQRGGHSNDCGYFGAATDVGNSTQGYVFTGNKYSDGVPVTL